MTNRRILCINGRFDCLVLHGIFGGVGQGIVHRDLAHAVDRAVSVYCDRVPIGLDDSGGGGGGDAHIGYSLGLISGCLGLCGIVLRIIGIRSCRQLIARPYCPRFGGIGGLSCSACVRLGFRGFGGRCSSGCGRRLLGCLSGGLSALSLALRGFSGGLSGLGGGCGSLGALYVIPDSCDDLIGLVRDVCRICHDLFRVINLLPGCHDSVGHRLEV